ncbi:MAG: sulfotransferase family protein [Candidatus Nanoarchaeia archaeon]
MIGPILVTGTQRSGTTIMEEVLNTHPEGYITHELNLIHMLQSINGALFHPKHTTRKVLPYQGEYSNIIQILYEGSTHKKLAFFGDKVPEYILEHDTISRFIPDSKFIFCTRNPLYVLSSMKRRNQDAKIGLDRGWKQVNLDEMCNKWVISHKEALRIQDTNSQRLLIVSYDDQTLTPAKTYELISAFLNISNSFDISAIKPNKPEIILNTNELNHIRKEVKEIAKEFNYEL